MHQRSPFSPSPSYLDPITGNILIQVVLAGAAAVAVGYNSLKNKIQLLLGKKSDEKKDETAREEEKSEEKKASNGSTEEAVQAPPS